MPVNSFATGRLPLPRGLGAILVVLGVALVAGFLTIIRAAAGESLVPPGEPVDARRRRTSECRDGNCRGGSRARSVRWREVVERRGQGVSATHVRIAEGRGDLRRGWNAPDAATPGARHVELSRDLCAGRSRPRQDDAPVPRELHGDADVRASASDSVGLAGVHDRSADGSRRSLSAVRRHHARERLESERHQSRRDSCGAGLGRRHPTATTRGIARRP